jgi:glycosyltransferase involved in cell wall biosynthesis
LQGMRDNGDMICFVTNEITPGKRGGFGFYVEGALVALESCGVATGLLLLPPENDAGAVSAHLRSLGVPGPVFSALELAGRGSDPRLASLAAPGNAHGLSLCAAQALLELCEAFPVRAIEFPDYCGYGAATIARKRLLGEFAAQTLVVRAHGTAELIRRAEGRRYGIPRELVTYLLESYAVRHADLLMASTRSVLEEYRVGYGRQGEGVVSPLPVRRITERPLPFRPVHAPPCKVLCIGTVQAQKGVDIFVQGAVRVLRTGLEGVTFVVMGRDFSTSARYVSFAEECRRIVPPDLLDCFDFRLDYYGPQEMLKEATECSFAVLPSRWEAFCLVAHELRWLGTPLLLSSIGPFEDCFVDGEDAVLCSGDAQGVADAMLDLLTGRRALSGRGALAGLYVERPGFADAYRQLHGPPPVRVPQEADPTVSVVVLRMDGSDAAARSVASARASAYEDVEVFVAPVGRECFGTPVGLPGAEPATVAGYHPDSGSAREAALRAGTGAYVCVLAQGTEVAPGYLGAAVTALQRCPELAYVSCIASRPDGVVSGPAYGLDPVLVTVEDGTGLAWAVMRRDCLGEHGLEVRPEFSPLEAWEFGWSMAQAGLTGEVLPMTMVRLGPGPGASRRVRYHLLQRMAEEHGALLRDHASEVLKGHLSVSGPGQRQTVTDRWLMQQRHGLRLIRLGVRKCAQESPRAVLSQVLSKLARRLRRAR